MDKALVVSELERLFPFAFVKVSTEWDNQIQANRHAITVTTSAGSSRVFVPDGCSVQETVEIVVKQPMPAGSRETRVLSPSIWAHRAKQRLDEHLQYGNPYDG